MPTSQAPVHNSPSRARDEQTVIATGIKAEVPEKEASEHRATPKPDSPSTGWRRHRALIAFLSAVALVAVLAMLYAWNTVQ